MRGRRCLPEGSAGAGPEAPAAGCVRRVHGALGPGKREGGRSLRGGTSEPGARGPSGEAGLPRLSPSSASPLLTAPAGGARAQFSRMMPRKRKRLTPLNAVQSKPSFSPADTSGSLTVVLDGNSSPVSSKYFSEEKRTSSRLGTDFFNQPCISLAKSFLGQILVHKLPDGRELRGRIVETEAYLGGEDAASHSKGGKQTARNAAMFMKPGTLYVYQIYGIYFCMNVSSQGEGAAVLLRSLEPLQGLDTMRQLRSAQRKGSAKPLKDWQLCNGPAKLCQAFSVNKSFDQKDLTRDRAVWMEPGSEAPGEQAVVTAARIGVSYGGEWAQKPLRFYIRGNKCVSVVDKKVESEQGAAD